MQRHFCQWLWGPSSWETGTGMGKWTSLLAEARSCSPFPMCLQWWSHVCSLYPMCHPSEVHNALAVSLLRLVAHASPIPSSPPLFSFPSLLPLFSFLLLLPASHLCLLLLSLLSSSLPSFSPFPLLLPIFPLLHIFPLLLLSSLLSSSLISPFPLLSSSLLFPLLPSSLFSPLPLFSSPSSLLFPLPSFLLCLFSPLPLLSSSLPISSSLLFPPRILSLNLHLPTFLSVFPSPSSLSIFPPHRPSPSSPSKHCCSPLFFLLLSLVELKPPSSLGAVSPSLAHPSCVSHPIPWSSC